MIISNHWRCAARTAAAVLFASVAGLRADAPAVGDGALILRNGDRFTGRLERLDVRAGALVFRHERLREPLALPLEALAEFRAAGAADRETTPGRWSFDLTEGDVLFGAPVSLDDRAITIQTPHAGRLSVARDALRSLQGSGSGQIIYDGPGPSEDWPHQQGGPQFAAESIVLPARAKIGRALRRIPPRLWIEFEAEWSANARMNVHFFGDRPDAQPGANALYALNLHGGNRLDLHCFTPGSGARRVGQTTFQPDVNESGDRFARIAIAADPEKSRFEVFVNDTLTVSWKDPGSFPAPGPALAFHSLQTGTVTLRKIRVREWSGRLDRPAELDQMSGVLFRLSNGDTINGDWLAIADGAARIRTGFGEMQVPLERVSEAVFLGPAGAGGRAPGAVQLHLRDGAILTLTPESLDAGRFTGISERYGRVHVPLSAITRLRWALDPPRPAAPARR